jgi:hypothetical protein
MRIPRLNRLTGLRWWQHMQPRDDSPETSRLQEAGISRCLRSPDPCAIGKIGTTELLGLEFLTRWIRPPWPKSASWHRPAKRLYECSGLFPVRKDIFYRWANEYTASLAALDCIGQWQPGLLFEGVIEDLIISKYNPKAERVGDRLLHFLPASSSWLNDLAKLRWLIIHPFEKTIQAQLPILMKLAVFSESSYPDLTRRSSDTSIIPCPQLPYMIPPRHRDWFEALEDLKAQMENESFDIALVGAGAWSLPLVAHAKQIGKKGMHLGGALQLLFGIKGGRYDSCGFYNEFWTRPLPNEVPSNFKMMEHGAYW